MDGYNRGCEFRVVAPTTLRRGSDRQFAGVAMNQCFRCDYSLQGLSETGRCPECGLEFDRRAVVVEQEHPFRKVVLILTSFLTVLIGLRVCAVFFLGEPLGPVDLTLLMVIGSAVYLPAIPVWFMRPRPNRAVVSDDGIWLIYNNGRVGKHPWSELGTISLDKVWGSVISRWDGDHRLVVVEYEFFRTMRRTSKFIAAIEAWRRQHPSLESAPMHEQVLNGPPALAEHG